MSDDQIEEANKMVKSMLFFFSMEAWPQEIDDTMMKVLADLMPKNQINLTRTSLKVIDFRYF